MAVDDRDVRGTVCRQLLRRLFVFGRRVFPSLQPRERATEVIVDLEAVDAVRDERSEVAHRVGRSLLAQRNESLSHLGVENLVLFELVFGIRAGRRRIAGAAGTHVAQRAEFLEKLGRHRRRSGGRAGRRALRAKLLLETAAHRARTRRLAIDEVLQLGRIAIEIVQLRLRREDVLPSPVAHRAQIAPAVVDQRDERFGERRRVAERAAAKRGGQTAARRRRRLHADHLQHRRKQIDRTGDAVDRRARLDARSAEDERNVQRGFVHEVAVNALAVIAESFAVIRRHDDERPIGDTGVGQRRQQPADELVRPRDFPVVRPIGVLDGVAPRRLVRIVRIVQVHPRKEPLRRVRPDPRHRVRGRGVAASLNGVEKPRIVFGDVESIGERIETALQTRSPREHDGADESRGCEPRRLQRVGHQRHVAPKRRRDVVANAVLGRIASAEDRDVRRTRERHLHVRVPRERAFAGDPIDVRRRDVLRAVRADMIGAKRVDRDEEEIPRDR